MLEIQDLRAGYPGKDVLKDVSISIPEGRITVILGPNGCGKSTLLKVLCGILPAAGGDVTLGGQSLLGFSQRQLAQRIAYLAQNRQIPDISVSRLVLHGRFPYLSYPRRYRREDRLAAEAAMAQMGLLPLADTRLQNLSGGQQQKAYIAMALAQDTPVILLDEPTTYLDISHQLQMMQQAQTLCGAGKTVVMVLHDLSHALQVAHEIVVMADGTVVAQGTPQAILDTGCLDAVFGVHVCQVMTEQGWQYFCTAKSSSGI